MVVDSSALVAILLGESDAAKFARAIDDSESPSISAVSYYEAAVVMSARKGELGKSDLDVFVRTSGITTVAFDEIQAAIAHKAYQDFGKGRHKARLNFADCASYALAKSMGEPLLFKGSDFALTDIEVAGS